MSVRHPKFIITAVAMTQSSTFAFGPSIHQRQKILQSTPIHHIHNRIAAHRNLAGVPPKSWQHVVVQLRRSRPSILLPLSATPDEEDDSTSYQSAPSENCKPLSNPKFDISFTVPSLYDSKKKNVNESSNMAPSSIYDLTNIATLVATQVILIPISLGLAILFKISNYGLGVGFSLSKSAVLEGVKSSLPLFGFAGFLRVIEPFSPALQGVTKATQRSVLAIMGKQRRLGFALIISVILGVCAGIGEEWLFRGIIQTALSAKFSSNVALLISGVVFGLLHAVTPAYALLAAAASFFFGYLYNTSGNLAIPMISHASYDVVALVWAHYTATGLTAKEQEDVLESLN